MRYKVTMNPDLFLRIKDGEKNPDFDSDMFAYRDDLITQGAYPYREGNYLVVNIDTNKVSFNVNDFLLIVSNDGSVDYFNPLIRVNEDNIGDEIPEGLPNRKYEELSGTTTKIDDETGEEYEESIYETKIHTWETWRNKSHPLSEPIETEEGSFYYFMSATFGKTLTSEELMLIYNSTGVTLVDEKPTIK